jgi:peptidoglycan hydrolase-like protein with peptidoglycan-binding domain
VARRRTAAAAVGLVVLAGGGGGSWWATHRPEPAPAQTVPVSTAAVVRTDLATNVEIAGTLRYTGARTLSAQADGTLTGLPRLGAVITRGRTLFEVDDEPVLLAYGRRPAWRSLSLGVSRGRDVRALERNLVALGYATSHTLTVDTAFTSATAAAVRRWQLATGRPRTGTVAFGQVIFAPGAVRISSLPLQTGNPVHPGVPVLGITATKVNVIADVPADRTALVTAGNRVTVTLPNLKRTPGRVRSVSSVASGPADPDSGDGSNGSGQDPATVQAVVSLTKPKAAGTLDQAPVTVNVVGESARNAIVVPVTALVALADGGVAVYVRDGATRTLVAVTPGMYTDTQVQLIGETVRVGQRVEVPAS